MNDDLILKMILDESGFTAGMNNAVRKLDSFDGTVSNSGKKGGSKLGSIWTSFVGNFAAAGAMKVVSAVTNGVMELGSELSSNSATWKTFTGNMQNLGKSKGEIAAVKKELQKFATQTIYSASDMATTYSQLEAVGIKSSDQLVKGFGGLAAAAEDPTQAMKTLSQQATQMAAKPMVQWQDFKLMLEQTPAGIAAVAKTMGMSTSEMVSSVQDGKIATQDFFDAITKTGTNDTFGKMATQYKTVGQAMDGLKETLTGKLQPAYDRVSKVAIDGIEKVVDWVSKIDFDKVIDDVKNVIGVIKDIAPIISGIAGAMLALKAMKTVSQVAVGIKTIITAVKGFKTAITMVKSFQGALALLKFAIAAAGGPVTIIIAAIGALVGVITYLWTTNEDFRKAVINIWNGIKDAFVSAGKAIKEAWQGMKEWFGDIWTGIKEGSSNAAEGVKNGWSGTKEWFSNLWTSIKETSSNAWSTFKETIMPFISPFIEEFKMIFSNVSIFLSNIWMNIVQIATNYFEILKNVILAPILFITSMITGGWSEARNNMIAVWNNIRESALNIWSSIQNIFSLVISGIVATGKYLWSEFKAYLINTWNSTKSNAVFIWNSIKTFFQNTWNSIKTTASNTWNSIKATMINTWNSIKSNFWNIVNGIVQSAENAWTNLKNGVKNAINRVKNTFDELRNINLFEIGKNIIQGLIDGVAAKANAVAEKVKGIAGNIKKSITNALDIHSPSRWMRDMVGKNIVQGIIVGLGNEQPKLDQAMDGLVTTPDIRPTVASSAQQPFANARTTSKDTNANQSNEIHLHLNVYGDLPDSMIKQIAKKMKTELTRQMKRDADATGGALYAN